MPVSVRALVLLAASADDAPAETRRRILQAVQRYPGLAAAELARQTHTSSQLMDYHLHALVRSGLVSISDDETAATYFAAAGDSDSVVDRRDRTLLGALRRPMVLRIALQLLEEGTMSMGDLATACGISPATATHHIKRMQKTDVVQVQQEGRSRTVSLIDPGRLRQLLIDHPPPHDVVAGFIEMWDRLEV